MDDMPGWTDYARRDGFAVAPIERAGAWSIVPPVGEPILACPCCDKPLATERAAKLVCNALFPLPSA